MSSTAKRLIVLVSVALVLAGLLMVKAKASRESEAQLLKVFSQVSYDQALANADSDGKFLLVYATASWCPPCQQMKKETWPDPRVLEWITQHGSAVLVDIDNNEDAALSLGIREMPTMVLFKGNKELGRVTGGMSAEELLAWLNQTAG